MLLIPDKNECARSYGYNHSGSGYLIGGYPCLCYEIGSWAKYHLEEKFAIILHNPHLLSIHRRRAKLVKVILSHSREYRNSICPRNQPGKISQSFFETSVIEFR